GAAVLVPGHQFVRDPVVLTRPGWGRAVTDGGDLIVLRQQTHLLEHAGVLGEQGEGQDGHCTGHVVPSSTRRYRPISSASSCSQLSSAAAWREWWRYSSRRSSTSVIAAAMRRGVAVGANTSPTPYRLITARVSGSEAAAIGRPAWMASKSLFGKE